MTSIKQRALIKFINVLSGLGSGRECPFCGWTGVQFAPRISSRKPSADAVCPQCLSLERHRLLKLILDERMRHQRSVLHFAPEGLLAPYLQERSDSYRSCDIQPGRAMDREDITALSYADEAFDFIMCNQVLEHIPDDKKAMSELYRVLSQDGVCILSVPLWRLDETYEDEAITEPAAREQAFGQSDHVRLYGMRDFVGRLKAAGFLVEMISARDFDPKLVGVHGLNHLTTGEVFICRK